MSQICDPFLARKVKIPLEKVQMSYLEKKHTYKTFDIANDFKGLMPAPVFWLLDPWGTG